MKSGSQMQRSADLTARIARPIHHPFSSQPKSPTRCLSVRADYIQREQNITRRSAISVPLLSALLWQATQPSPGHAVQGYTAGRIPGLSKETDEDGFRTYTRPAGKQGGHGVGWSEIPPYKFKVPDGWKEVPVSIADLGGTEIDLRFGNDADGKCVIVVAPVMRFANIDFNSDVRIEKLGKPEQMISGFGPELFGSPLQDGDVLDTQVTQKDGVTFYQWELKPHRLVAATAYKNRVFLMALDANARQWRKSQKALRKIWQSFDLALDEQA